MSALQGQAGELSFTVQITRKDTGQVEEHQLVGFISADQAEALGLHAPTDTETNTEAKSED